jgi:L-alanine-DL-glutamate epimerase-like enolase superfamily enzyme
MATPLSFRVIELAKRAEPYNPFLIEDPIRHENPQALAQVRASTRIPLATVKV